MDVAAGGSVTRKLLLLVIPVLFLHASVVQALGVGEIDLKSALNQPFDAEIDLLSARGEDLKTIDVSLAPNAAFEKVGIDRQPILSQLVFRIAKRSDGTPYIKVTSSQPIKEPFLDFIVAVQWPAGQLLREYTVLLDPPVLTREEPGPQTAPVTQSEPAPRVTTPAPREAAPATTPPPAAAARDGLEYGPTRRTDTLWSIAEQVRPDESVSIPQTMMALLKSNPDAFYNGNINDLKAGYVLRIDDPRLLTEMSRSAAERESRRQYQEWLARKQGTTDVAERPVGSVPARDTAAAGQAADQGPRLRLTAPTEEELAAMEAAGTASSGAEQLTGVEELREELALTAESADRASAENTELREQVAALEQQIAEMQRLLTLKDDTLTRLQAQGRDQAATAGDDAPRGGEPELLDSPVVLSIGLVILLGIATLGWLIYRRRQLQAISSDTMAFAPAPVAAAARGDTAVDRYDEGAAEISDFTATETGISAEIDDIDVISEADVYLAYQRYSQAENLIRGAIEQNPERLDLKLKLLEIYFAAQDKERFIAQAEALHEAVGGAAGENSETWLRATTLGQEMAPEHPLFGGEADRTPEIEEDQDQGTTPELFEDTLDTAASEDYEKSLAGEDAAMSGEILEPGQDDNLIEFESGLYDKEQAAAGTRADEELDIPLADGRGESRVDSERRGRTAAGDLPEPAELPELQELADDTSTDFDEMTDLDLDTSDFDEEDESHDLDSSDIVATKLDLAKAYVDMGDQEGARTILEEVLNEGNDGQKREARELLQQIQ